jgi:hypothetical protein
MARATVALNFILARDGDLLFTDMTWIAEFAILDDE